MMLALLIAAGWCGSERWDVKTLADRGALALQRPQKATVEQLLSLRAPRWSRHARRRAIERNVVVVDVEVLAFKNEPDGDLHVVIRGERGQVMVAEFPSAAYTFGASDRATMEKARRTFVRLARAGVQRMRLTGVVFF